MDSLNTLYTRLLQDFPALYELTIWQRGKVLLHRENSTARESSPSRMYRGLLRLWAGAFSAPPETFRHKIAGRSNIRSATKSIVALLVGIALQDGLIKSLDQALCDLLPEELTHSVDPSKQKISLRHLLTMTSGLASMESGMNALRLFSVPDWTRFMLQLPLVSEPGTRFLYNSANPHLVSAVLSHLSGKSLLSYADRKLFEPLGIRDVHWGAGPEGTTFGGGNLFLCAGDLARIGELCLQRGHWQNRQLLPERWFEEMWRPCQEYLPGWKYGYYWYLHPEIDSQTGCSYMTYSAAGAGGQKLLLIPELGLILSVISKTDFIGERGLVLNQFISEKLLNAIETTTKKVA